MSINGTIGNLAFYSNEKIVLGKSAAYINCNHNLAVRDFIFYQLQSYKLQKYFNDELTGSTIKNLSLKSIRFTPIVYTENNEEQNIITFKLKSIEQVILREHSKLKKLEHLKQGLMSKLLNGEV